MNNKISVNNGIFREKEKVKEIFSSPRYWKKVRGGLFTRPIPKELPPEQRSTIYGERCEAVLNSFINPKNFADVRRSPFGRILLFIASRSTQNLDERAKEHITAFFSAGGKLEDGEHFIKIIEDYIYQIAAAEVFHWEARTDDALTELAKKGITVDEVIKISSLRHTVGNTLGLIGSLIANADMFLKQMQISQ